jgi:GTP cyclohydrolase I
VSENSIPHSIDENKIRRAVRLFLDGIGEDPDREGLLDTPDRVARMCHEIFAGLGQDAEPHLSKIFNTESSGLVIERNIRFYSLCEHHLMPFWGYVHIAYLPDGKVTGLSKLARTVEVYARRPQIQENLTHQIMDALVRLLQPKGVMVVVEAEHMCMSMRGVKKDGAKTVTTAVGGSLEKDTAFQNTFLQSLG